MNSKHRNLILFTNSFPFGLKETYLETEIKYLSDNFNRVIIYPLYYNEKNKTQRKVPLNALVNTPPIPTSKVVRLFKFILSLLKGAPVYQFIKEYFIFKLYTSISKTKRWFFELIDYSIVSNSKQLISIKGIENSILYFYWGTGWSYSLNYLRKKETNRYFVRVHGGEAFLERSNGYIPLRNSVFKNADYIMAISSLLVDYINVVYNIDRSKIVLSRLGTEFIGINPRNNSSIIRIVTVANLIELKRIDLLVNILGDIKDKTIEWFHFGDGPLENRIIQMAKDKLPNNIKFVYKKRTENKYLLKFYKEIPVDCFINLSIYEGLPVSIMEAMSFGIPVIATSAGATNEIVNNETGLLVPINFDLNEVQKKIQDLKSEDWIHKREHAKRKWEKDYSAPKNYKQLINIFKTYK